MPKTPDEMLSAVSQSLAARTGRSLEQWLTLVRAASDWLTALSISSGVLGIPEA